MALKLFKHKKHKITLISLAVLLLLIFGLAFFLNRYWAPILSAKVKSVVLSSTDSLYKVNFSSAELDILEGEIIIHNIDLKIDTNVYNRRKAQHLAPNNLTELHVKRLILSHIHPFKLYFRHILDIDRISLSAPRVHMSYQLNHTKDTINKDRRTVWQKISKSLKYIHVGDIFLDDVKFKYDDYSGNKLLVSELKEMNLQANELLIDSVTQTDKSRLLYCKDIFAELNNYKGKTPNGLYAYSVKKLKISTRASQLNAEGLIFEPVNPHGFFNKTKKDRYTVHLDSLQLNNFDFLTYHKYRTLSASSLVINSGRVSLFNNPNKVPNNKDKVSGFPHVIIHQIGTDIRLDTVKVSHLNVSYSEYNKKTKQDGTIQFNNTGGTLLNITNNKTALQKNNLATVQLTSYFMSHGKLNISFSFNLTDKDAAYAYKVHLGPMDLGLINPATMPFAMVKITSGTLKSLDFDFKADSKTSKGKVVLLYNDLKINILKADTENQVLKNKVLISLYANLFILKHDNPDKESLIPRSFNVNYVRPKNSPFFKTIWKSLLIGLKPAVGYDDKTQKAVTARMEKGKLDKKNREIRKTKRQERRAERKLKRAKKEHKKEAEKAAKSKQ
ncbi:MAG: DUF748 domain-containing protein [Bacteroidota bacterium]